MALLQDPVFNKVLLDDLIGIIEQVRNASTENLTFELTNLTNAAEQLPSFEPITAEQLGNGILLLHRCGPAGLIQGQILVLGWMKLYGE